MNPNLILLLPVFFPVFAGILLAGSRLLCQERKRAVYVAVVSLLELVFVGLAGAGDYELVLFRMSDRLAFTLRPDRLSILFGVLCAAMWLASAVYAAGCMRGQKGSRLYQIFFLVSVGLIAGLCFSGNLLTAYLFYELMTLALLPLVIHERSKEAIRAGLSFLFYSIGGAFLGLAGFFIFYSCGISFDFREGGWLGAEGVRKEAEFIVSLSAREKQLVLAGCFCAAVGFGSKAGLFPMHGWLPSAHPVAPAPASALLSGNVTKMGLLVILRVIYYIVGPEFLRGTWVQYTLCALALSTVLIGSVIASREQLLKRRLAYSTIGQVSYALFGVFVLNRTALLGALLHVVFHSLAKNTLFLCAGTYIHETGRMRADELEGVGRRLPATTWIFTFASLTLVGIPPTSAFLSKWYLAQGSLEGAPFVFSWLGPAILLVSAVFTAFYLLPVTVKGFFPGRPEEENMASVLQGEDSMAAAATESGSMADALQEKDGKSADAGHPQEKGSAGGRALRREAPLSMLVPPAVLAAFAVGFGILPGGLLRFLEAVCRAVLN